MVELASPRPVSDALAALVDKGALTPDPLQQQSAATLDRIASQLSREPRGLFSRLLGKPEPVRGAYLVGQVGRGKTMLMDLFFETVPEPRKRRVHFHEFLADVHGRVHAYRQKIKSGEIKETDPIALVASDLSEDAYLLCFDEFTVTDIADAMILGRLFTALFAAGSLGERPASTLQQRGAQRCGQAALGLQ